jgi:ribonuclease-3
VLDQRADLKAAHPYGNERLEFLGDRVLSLAISQQLLQRFPNEQEGQIARRHSVLVSARVLAEIAEEIGLRELMVGAAEAPRATSTILADAMEALLGAVFLDAGFEAAAGCVQRLWGERLASNLVEARPPKTELQEWAQARRLGLPAYRQVGRAGREHEPVFTVEVKVGKHGPAEGSGPTKRDAESAAAAAMLALLAQS